MSAASVPRTLPAHDVSPTTGPSTTAPTDEFGRLATDEEIARAVAALEQNGIRTIVVPDAATAKATVLGLLPEGSEVFDGSSQTLETLGLSEAIRSSPHLQPVRPLLMQMMTEGRLRDQRKAGAAPDYFVGSVHAITQDGRLVVASASGSQLGPYAYGAGSVIWVAGTQKIVPDLAAAFRRIEEYTFPLENERAKKAYGQGSVIAKLLVINREVQPGRATLVLVKENLGY